MSDPVLVSGFGLMVRKGEKPALAKVDQMGEHERMAKGNPQSEVVELIAYERGLAREKVHLSDRLLQDLGMDGDDAVDFFNAVHARFGTDLTPLGEHWSEHFGPEGFSWRNGLIILPAAILGGAIAGIAGLSIFWGLAIAVASLGAWLGVMRRSRPPDRMIPITVEEVIAAVEAGAWPGRSQT